MASTEYFTKDYILLKSEYNKSDNERQFNDVRQSAIQRGLRPTGDVEFVKSENHGAVSVRLYYRVPVELASEASDFVVRHAHVDQDQQKAFEETVDVDEDPVYQDRGNTAGVGELKSAVDTSGETPERPTDPDTEAGSTEQAAKKGDRAAAAKKKGGNA